MTFGRISFVNKTGTSQVGGISNAQIKSKGDPLETKNFEKKLHSAEKKNERSHGVHGVKAKSQHIRMLIEIHINGYIMSKYSNTLAMSSSRNSEGR